MRQREPALTVALCSNRPQQLLSALPALFSAIHDVDHPMVVVDTAAVGLEIPLREAVQAAGRRASVLLNGQNMGLAYSRNRALKECPTEYVLFVDDDIAITRDVVDAVRAAFSRGVDIVGARITADFGDRSVPWYLTPGQLHYLGTHAAGGPASIWGGCLGVDVERARMLGVEFNETLGRTADTLCSAEDTTFVREMVMKGAVPEFLDDAEVMHDITPQRLRLGYLLRRSYWQGRSEARRHDARRGIRKEWARNWSADCPPLRRGALALMYVGSVTLGAAHEHLVTWSHSGDDNPGRGRSDIARRAES